MHLIDNVRFIINDIKNEELIQLLVILLYVNDDINCVH